MKNRLYKPIYRNLSGIALLLTLTVLSFSCRKKTEPDAPPTLPPITMTGANTMGANVNGQLWLPAPIAFLSTSRSLCTSYNATDGFYLTLSHNHPGSKYTGGDAIIISYKNFNSTGTYDLTDATKATLAVFVEDGADVHYMDNFTVTQGTLIITKFDLASKVISGQFSFSIRDNNLKITHTVTDGRFDVTINYCQ